MNKMELGDGISDTSSIANGLLYLPSEMVSMNIAGVYVERVVCLSCVFASTRQP